MASYQEMSKEELLKEKESLLKAYEEWQKRGLTLNMARGKPSAEQLDLAYGLLNAVNGDSILDMNTEIDTRNYGGVDGIKPAKELIASMVDADPEDVIVYGNSSLNMMFDTIGRAMIKGICGSKPWGAQKGLKWLCPAPGYDRHFGVTEYYGFELITIPMHEDGPDMDMVEELVSSDPSIKGIWCVPKFSNPQGYVYSDETVRRFANLKPAAEDFRIFWDNAYCVHYLYDEIKIPNLLEEARKAGNEDLVFEFVSTSKVSLAGGGIAGLVTSKRNREDALNTLRVQTIGHDKVNQLRHAVFFDNGKKIPAHMKRHAAILTPKFEAVLSALERDLGGKDCGSWVKPLGGYFITFTTLPGCATRTIELAKEAGMTMTGAGAPFPYGKDPEDSTIRIAPSYPSLADMKMAADLFTVCVRLAAVEKLLEA
ncbi:DNA-binding transcriptional regulator, MocR family, contains an aminotransferase domain [Lachnospiraceae bacterium KHCPX20]|jgi:aspartate/methionine/tyrosine aminotransferase|nr:DNA-binding transcriptional regulator, MocR family, contains an aminotransferase domain [Lachnospiraceae bacterium KHCPX20]